MFLIGITGSLLPYLILLGVTFLFSMQVTAWPDGDVFNSDETSVASNYQLFIPVTSRTFTVGDYRVVYDDGEYASECLLNDGAVMHIPDCCSVLEIAKWPVRGLFKVEVELLLSQQLFDFSFSGLSPPVIMS